MVEMGKPPARVLDHGVFRKYKYRPSDRSTKGGRPGDAAKCQRQRFSPRASAPGPVAARHASLYLPAHGLRLVEHLIPSYNKYKLLILIRSNKYTVSIFSTTT